MGNLLSSLTISTDDCIAASLVSSQLVHRRALSTCYDPIFDVSLSSKNKSILVSDDGRLRLFRVDLDNNEPLIEMNPSSTKVLAHDQVQDIAWNCELDRFLILTNKRLATFDQENNLVNLDLQLEKGTPPLWRMACWSSHLLLNVGVGASIRYYRLNSSSLSCVHAWSRSQLDYQPSDSLSCLALSPQLTVAINVELAEHRHVIDLFALGEKSTLTRLQRLDSPQACPLDVITSLRDYTWLCKSHWPSDDCLCLIESDGQVKKVTLQEQTGYILNARLVNDRSHLVVVRTPTKLPNETEQTESTDNTEHHRRQRQAVGKLPPNLLLEIYRIPSTLLGE